MTALFALALALAAALAAAHGLADAWANGAAWTYDPWVVVPLYASGILYLRGTLRLWARGGHGRGVRRWQVACFWCGWTLLALALVSPLHWLGERLFVAHMLEHEIVMVAAAPLLAAARPVGAFLWGLPQGWRRALGGLARRAPVASAWRAISDPLAATLLHAVALWAWHMPLLYNAVLADVTAHRLQHVSFLVTALLFWWSLLYGRARARGYGAAVLYLFATMLHSAALGILLTLSRAVWYPAQGPFAAALGLTPLQDQQLAGLIMWVPAGLVYTAAALAFAARWIARAGDASLTGAQHAPAA
jgi:cytochrome c oxidase assembly factor CtaG